MSGGAGRPGCRAQSHTTGVVILVALAIIIAAGVGAFAFTTADSETTPPPQVTFNMEYVDGCSQANPGTGACLDITHSQGDTFRSANVVFEIVEGSNTNLTRANPWPAEVSTSDTLRLANVTTDQEIIVKWIEPREDGKTVILDRYEGENA